MQASKDLPADEDQKPVARPKEKPSKSPKAEKKKEKKLKKKNKKNKNKNGSAAVNGDLSSLSKIDEEQDTTNNLEGDETQLSEHNKPGDDTTIVEPNTGDPALTEVSVAFVLFKPSCIMCIHCFFLSKET